MNACARRVKATDLYHQLSKVRDELNRLATNEDVQIKAISMARAKMACVEHQISILRLTQAEDRLLQYFWRAIFGLLGAGFALLAVFLSR